MLMWLFFLFVGLALILCAIGYSADFPLFDMTGMIILFLLGMTLLSSGLTYKIGSEDVYVYGNYFDGYHWDGYNTTAPSQTDKEAYLFHTNTSDLYGTYDDAGGSRFGWLLLAFGALGFAMSMFRL